MNDISEGRLTPHHKRLMSNLTTLIHFHGQPLIIDLTLTVEKKEQLLSRLIFTRIKHYLVLHFYRYCFHNSQCL